MKKRSFLLLLFLLLGNFQKMACKHEIEKVLLASSTISFLFWTPCALETIFSYSPVQIFLSAYTHHLILNGMAVKNMIEAIQTSKIENQYAAFSVVGSAIFFASWFFDTKKEVAEEGCLKTSKSGLPLQLCVDLTTACVCATYLFKQS